MNIARYLAAMLVGIVFCGAVGWGFCTGLWLLSNTDYPYWRVVGGGTLICATFGALVGLAAEAEGGK